MKIDPKVLPSKNLRIFNGKEVSGFLYGGLMSLRRPDPYEKTGS
ncbi:MAG TPA: hypothetical protein VLH59_05050 [Ignavibacteriaceae bacterium]|nr:hypothetical protein [Ignavibacteriaceae bacterium]